MNNAEVLLWLVAWQRHWRTVADNVNEMAQFCIYSCIDCNFFKNNSEGRFCAGFTKKPGSCLGSHCWFGSRFDWTQRVFKGCIAWIMILWSTLQTHTVIFSARLYLIRRLTSFSFFCGTIRVEIGSNSEVPCLRFSSHLIFFLSKTLLHCLQ